MDRLKLFEDIRPPLEFFFNLNPGLINRYILDSQHNDEHLFVLQ